MASPRTSRPLPPGVAHSRRAAVLMLIGLIAARSPLPYTAVAAIPLVWAGVELILALRDRSTAAPSPQAPARGIVASSVVSLVLVAALTVLVLLPYAFYGTVRDFQDCTRGANTSIAAADCNASYQRSLNSTLGGLLTFGQRAGG